jgi:hypothetical protein
MKKHVTLMLLPVALLLPSLGLAQSAFVGTWKADIKNNIQLPKKPSVYLLAGGVYHCKTCAPPWSVPADGRDHKVTGHPYFDTAAIKVVDDNTIQETDKKAGKTVTTVTSKVAADGKTLDYDLSDSSASSGAPVAVKGESARVTNGPTGSHTISGSWRATKLESVSDNGLLTTWALDGSTLKMTTPTGQSYSAPLDGTEAPFTGDPGQTSISMKKVNDHTLDEIDKRDGKVIGSAHLTVSADGKTMTVAWKDALHGTDGSFSNVKQ